MIKDEYKVIGVMSGTSLDGVDLALIHLTKSNCWKFQILAAETIPYSNVWKEILLDLTSVSHKRLKTLDKEYTVLLTKLIANFIRENNIEDLDFICSHGHTALHQPDIGITYQIGNDTNIAALLGVNVICDFRVQDVEFGGQGAPLVPIGDHLLFSDYQFCVNLGGFANVSTIINNVRIAYDICPLNIVLNKYVSKLGLPYDDQGKIAKSGSIHIKLLDSLNQLDFYSKKFPKSLGSEWVDQHIYSVINSISIKTEDILRTFIEHCSIQIAANIGNCPTHLALFTGGGSYNTFLIDSIKSKTKTSIILPSAKLIEYKEALIFGFLGVLRARGEINCLKSVTGAKKDHSSGKIYLV